jgi:hypothetical protein
MSLDNSSLHVFKNGAATKMTVTTIRNSKNHGLVEESTTTYKKGKLFPDRVSFSTKYTEYFVVEDRKKSLGKYDFVGEEIRRYERTDFDNRNQRTYTFYNYFYYDNSILTKEDIRTKEYVGQGSVEQDTVVYKDSVLYEIVKTDTGIVQKNLSDPGVFTLIKIEDELLISRTNYFEGYHEARIFSYDDEGNLVKITNTLYGADNVSTSSHTELEYDFEGQVIEAIFFDNTNEILERKVFEYK